MGNDWNSGRLGAFEDRFKRFGVVRHNTDRTDFLGDEVFDRAHLLSGVGSGGSDHVSFNVLLFTGFFDALLHGGEPRNAADLYHHGDFLLGGLNTSNQERIEKNECSGGCISGDVAHFVPF